MITQTIACDRCFNLIEIDRCPVTVSAGPFRTEQPIDLCRSCCAAFLDWVATTQVLTPTKGNPEPRVPETMRDVLNRTPEGAVLA